MPFIKLCRLSTQNRAPLLEETIRNPIIEHIKINAKAKGIYRDTINGYVDHLHCLIALKGDQTLCMAERIFCRFG